MEDIIAAETNPRNGRAGANFTSFIFAWLKQVDADPETSAAEFRLAWVLSQMTNHKTRVCFPLQSLLAKRLHISDRQVRTHLAKLESWGHLHVRHRGRDHSSVYQPVLQDRKKTSGLKDKRPEENFRSSIDHDRKFNVARPEVLCSKTGRKLPTEPAYLTNLTDHKRGAPKARQRRAPCVYVGSDINKNGNSSEVLEGEIVADGGVAHAPPPDHLARGVARARRLIQKGAQ